MKPTAEKRLFTSEDLMHFTGTEQYYRSDFRMLLCTDGVQFIREHGAAWLITAIESYQTHKAVRSLGFQLWTLTVNGSKAVLTCKEDSDCVPVITQNIPYTDFPLPEIKIYVIDGVVLLPSEY